MHRFFVSPESFEKEDLILRGARAHQIRDVLRLKPGEVIGALDNSGAEFRVELTRVARDEARGRVLEKMSDARESRTKIVLYQALLKADKFEWVLQKGAELGIAEFAPIVTARTVASAESKTKRARWERILTEAAEQSGRRKIPRVRSTNLFGDALAAHARDALGVIPWEEERARDLRAALSADARAEQVDLFIGPEGGFTREEIENARAVGVQPVTLGPRIFRAETACIVAASAIFFARGDLGAGARGD